jgi:hypothetical protein
VCTLLVDFDPDGATPIVVAANRDEFRTRASEPPHDWGDGVFAGRDLTAGGTWLAVGLGGLAAVTNVRTDAPRPDAPSRGLLPLAALRDELPAVLASWNPFNLVVARPGLIRVVTHAVAGGPVDEHELPPGRHAITNDSFGGGARTAAAARRLERLGATFEALRGHDPDPASALCRHGDTYGTVSASVVALDRQGRVLRYRHRAGPPCVAPEIDLDAAARYATTSAGSGGR